MSLVHSGKCKGCEFAWMVKEETGQEPDATVWAFFGVMEMAYELQMESLLKMLNEGKEDAS